MDKKTVRQMVLDESRHMHELSKECIDSIDSVGKDAINYMKALFAQIKSTGSDSLLAKTPKVPTKRTTRIKAIPENDELETSNDGSVVHNGSSHVHPAVLEISEISSGRAKRGASIKAAGIIKKQQLITLNTKLRRPSNGECDLSLADKTKTNRSKRPKYLLETSEDEDTRPIKQCKTEAKKSEDKIHNKIDKTQDVNEIINKTQDVNEKPTPQHNANETYIQEKPVRASSKRKLENQLIDANDNTTFKRLTRQNSLFSDEPVRKKANRLKSSSQGKSKDSQSTTEQKKSLEKKESIENKKSIAPNTSLSLICAQSSKKVNVINETMDMSNGDETVASMYEDAVGKPVPIMNSTMNPNSTVTLIAKMMNATVLLEPLSGKKDFDATRIVAKQSLNEPRSHNNSTIKEKLSVSKEPTVDAKSKESNNPIISKLQREEKINEYNDLLTDDESSPERKEYRTRKEKIVNQPKRVTRSNISLMSDDNEEVLVTPVKVTKPNKNYKGYKQPALFSPYAKDSVKKRVEAFEQVAVSPKQPETAGRITRTKTRALAAATETPVLTVTQKLARKSLAKAKKISLAKHAKESDETKENENINIVKSTKSDSVERSTQKPSGKTTPLGKTRTLQMPNSITKNNYATPSNSQYTNPYSKSVSAPRGNIVTNVDSFIQPMRSASKQIDRVAEDKKRRGHEEDARRKREELLKAQADEKRRKREEKELKNKLAREAKEKFDYEKRLKAEREREEKAKLAQQMQEKQKEEMERKRMAAFQRAQEKEERRKHEELLRFQRLQEQEEQEKILAEQKRREQEMEKRKQAEIMKMKNAALIHQSKAKALAQKQVPHNYKIDSDPDEEESDDENKPKHKIPNWASKNARQPQLTMQQHIPMRAVLKFFDAKECTPDLRELFRDIDPKKLKRSSSAIWKTPPRYSMMNCSIIRD